MDDQPIEVRYVYMGKTCRICRRVRKDLSSKGYCVECGLQKAALANLQVRQHKGYWFNKWRSHLIKGVKKLSD